MIFYYYSCGRGYVGEYCEYVNPCSLFIMNPCKNGGSCEVYMDQQMGAQATCNCSIGKFMTFRGNWHNISNISNQCFTGNG